MLFSEWFKCVFVDDTITFQRLDWNSGYKRHGVTYHIISLYDKHGAVKYEITLRYNIDACQLGLWEDFLT